MSERNWLILSILLSGTAAGGWAQTGSPAAPSAGVLTLEEAQREAVEHSPLYHQAQAAEREASWSQVEAISQGFLPHVSLSGKYFLSQTYAEEMVAFESPTALTPFQENFPIASFGLDADFDLFDGFRNVDSLNAANESHEAASLLSGWSLFQLQEQVRLKFHQALAARELSDMADQNVKTLEDHLRIVNDQLENGQATRYDVLRVEVQLSEAKSDQISAHDNVVLAREALAQAMGLSSDDRALSGELPVLDAEAILSALPAADFRERPDLKAKELQALAAEDRSAAAGSFWFPKISLIGEYQWYDSQDYFLASNTISNTGDFNTSYFIGAAATWDILDGGLSLAKANESAERAKQAQDDFEVLKIRAPYDYDFWKRRLVFQVALYQAKLTDVDKAKESARLATLGFKAGTRTTTDVLDAELDEFRAAAGLVQAQVDALEALINLELSVGRRISHEQ